MSNELVPHRNTNVSYGLCILGFFGLSGLHRFYMGRPVSGVLWLLTGGLCMVGTVIDLVMMPKMIEASRQGKGW